MSDIRKLWATPVATLAVMASVAALEAPSWVVELTKLWGPAFLILSVTMCGFVYFIPRSAVPDFIQSQKDQAIALHQISTSLTEISGHNGKLDTILANQEQMKLALTVGADRFKRLEENLLGRHPDS